MPSQAWRITRTLMISLMLLAVFFQFIETSHEAVAAQEEFTETQEKLIRLSDALGVDVTGMALGESGTIALSNGIQLERVSAVDPGTGEVFSAAFWNGAVVDEGEMRAQAAREWREIHGALTPILVEKMAAMGGDDTLDVSVWLFADIQSLPKPEAAHVLIAEDGLRTTLSLAERRLSRADQSQIQADIQAYKRQNDAQIQAQVAPIQDRFREYVQLNGLDIQYASQTTPVVYLRAVTREQLENLSRHPEVAVIYETSQTGGPNLNVARAAQTSDHVEVIGGYTGAGVNVAVVEGERADGGHPDLTVVSTRLSDQIAADHPTHVAGIIASTHNITRGLASGANIYSANGIGYGIPGSHESLSEAIDWAAINATVLNHSFWMQECGTDKTLYSTDMQLDFIVRYYYDLAVVASGNHRNNDDCQSSGSSYVNTPGKGFNTLTVGNFYDDNSTYWWDDWLNPSSQYNGAKGDELVSHKPELVASGTAIWSLAVTDAYTNWSGTSMAAPMVAATAANLIEADSSLGTRPAGLTAILLASSDHKLDTTEVITRPTGVGAINASAALVTVERGDWNEEYINGSMLPRVYSDYIHENQTVRVAIRWLSAPTCTDQNHPWTCTDPTPPDLRLKVRRDGSSGYLVSDLKYDNFEIVEFNAPVSGNYYFDVELVGIWDYPNTPLGIAWWVGPEQITADTGYARGKPAPMGDHYTVDPSELSPNYRWRAFGIRSEGSDQDLELQENSIFTGDSHSIEAISTYGSGRVDYITVYGSYWGIDDPESYHVYNFGGDGGYDVSWSNQDEYLSIPGIYGPFSFGAEEVVKVFDVDFSPDQTHEILIVPENGLMDLGAGLFTPAAADYAQGRGQRVAEADSVLPGGSEKLSTYFYDTYGDYWGLVVYKNDSTTGQFYIYVDPQSIYIPLITR